LSFLDQFWNHFDQISGIHKAKKEIMYKQQPVGDLLKFLVDFPAGTKLTLSSPPKRYTVRVLELCDYDMEGCRLALLASPLPPSARPVLEQGFKNGMRFVFDLELNNNFW
jgi:hypothetical protein